MKCNKLAAIVPMGHLHHVAVASTTHWPSQDLEFHLPSSLGVSLHAWVLIYYCSSSQSHLLFSQDAHKWMCVCLGIKPEVPLRCLDSHKAIQRGKQYLYVN